MLKRLRQSVGRALLGAAFPAGTINTGQAPPAWVLRAFGFSGVSAPVITERSALQLPPVFAAVTFIADMVGQLPPMVMKQDGESHTEDREHPVAMLLRSPNETGGIGRVTLMTTSQTHYNIAGNAYQQIERDAAGTPIRIWPLPETTTPLLPEKGGRGIIGYRTQINGVAVDLPPGDVIHPMGLSLDGYVGESPVRLCAIALQSSAQMEKYGLDFFLNESKSGGFLMHPGKLTDDAKRRVRKSLKDQAKADPGEADGGLTTNVGTRTHHDLKVLEEGMKFVDTTIAPEEAQFLGSREFVISEVARIWRIPLVLLQSIQGSTVWGTGIETLMIGFVQQTIMPIVARWEDEMTRKLLTLAERDAGYYIKFDVSGLLRGDAKSRAETNDIQIKNDSLTVNEARRMEGRNPIPGGDEPYSERQARLTPAPAPVDPNTPAPKKDEQQ